VIGSDVVVVAAAAGRRFRRSFFSLLSSFLAWLGFSRWPRRKFGRRRKGSCRRSFCSARRFALGFVVVVVVVVGGGGVAVVVGAGSLLSRPRSFFVS
jgi:membrane protease YdiL (CAAX protease family)